MKGNKGFSLIELLVSVGIIGVLASIATVAYLKYMDNARETVLNSFISDVREALKACVSKDDFQPYDSSLNLKAESCIELKIGGFLDIMPTGIDTAKAYNDDNLRVKFVKNTTAKKTCWDIRALNARDDKKGWQCVSFSIDKSSGISDFGKELEHTQDDGTKTGKCRVGGTCG